jgi:hypothetical protein
LFHQWENTACNEGENVSEERRKRKELYEEGNSFEINYQRKKRKI